MSVRSCARPKVSVCIPSRNTRAFLEERRQSIEKQSFTDYEVIIVDDGSTDGSWEFFKEWEAVDPRVTVHQGPGKGLYAGWNDTILRSKGEYIYIATSDDTMASNLLEVMVGALDNNADCGVAHCNLMSFRNENPGFEIGWWRLESLFALSVDGRVDKPHRRMAPGDGLLHGCGASVYVSTTQLLTRRRVFEEVGGFSESWGEIADFEWAVRVGLTTNVIHVPLTWGGWRIHDHQATNTSDAATETRKLRNLEIYENVVDLHKSRPAIAGVLGRLDRRRNFLNLRSKLRELRREGSTRSFVGFVVGNPVFLFEIIWDLLTGRNHWKLSDEKVMIAELKKTLNWIEED